MITVKLDFRGGSSEQETHRGVTISRWLKEQGLKMGQDYTWKIEQGSREIHFMFNSEAEAWATLLTMKEV